MIPLVVNLDSAFDWTPEVRAIWSSLDWQATEEIARLPGRDVPGADEIRLGTAPGIPFRRWAERAAELPLIGLVSSLVMEEAHTRMAASAAREDHLSREWRERQLRVGPRRRRQPHNEQGPGCEQALTGEEPSLRPPAIDRRHVVECYGVYTDDAASVLGPCGLLWPIPPALHRAPAILLSPERIQEIYSGILRLRQELRHPLPLGSNPTLINLRMLLLHELGHHFFPVHRAGAGEFLCEALANLFCYHGLTADERAWLLYKTWHLQPAEYSAYRPFGLLCTVDADCHAAVTQCFDGDLSGWRSMPKKSRGLDERFGASLGMALAVDAPAAVGLWERGLQPLVSEENRWWLHWDRGNLDFHSHRRGGREGDISADLVLDLYGERDLGAWAGDPDVPDGFWCGWGYGDTVSWPADCLHLTPQLWIQVYHQTTSEWLSSTARTKLGEFGEDPEVEAYVRRVLADPAHRPPNRSLDDAIGSLGWLLETFATLSLGQPWSKVLAEFAAGDPRYSERRGWGGTHRAIYALRILQRMPDFAPRTILSDALDQAAAFIRAREREPVAGDWHAAVQAIEFIEACGDLSAISALEMAAGSTAGYAAPVREAARRALDILRTDPDGDSGKAT